MINKHKSNKIKENSNTVRHWNNGTDHRHSKSCCDKSSPARRTKIELGGSMHMGSNVWEGSWHWYKFGIQGMRTSVVLTNFPTYLRYSISHVRHRVWSELLMILRLLCYVNNVRHQRFNNISSLYCSRSSCWRSPGGTSSSSASPSGRSPLTFTVSLTVPISRTTRRHQTRWRHS